MIIGGGLNALGIVRSLGGAGIPLMVADTDLKSPAMRSRHGRKLILPRLEGNELIESLLALAKDFATPAILFLTEEKTVKTVSEQRNRLTEKFAIRLPQHERLMQLMHKQEFYDLAKAYDAPVPQMVRLKGVEDLPLLEGLRFPCVFKPGEKNYAYGARFKKAYKVHSATEVHDLYRKIHPVLADMVVQEWIDGDDGEVYFCMQYVGENGKAISSFSGRKIRSWPVNIGGTASCTAAWEEAQELHDLTIEFFNQVGFTGMGSMEYKRDARDGRFYMVEPTVARTDFQEEVATINGVNMPLAAYLHETGSSPVAPVKISPPRVWREPLSDRWAAQESGNLAEQRSKDYPVWDAYRRWDDPLPWIDFMIGRVASRFASRK